MPYLRKRDNGAMTDLLDADSPEYQGLAKLRFSTQVNAAAGPLFNPGPAGSTPGTIAAGQPMFEAVAEEDVQPEAIGALRVGVVVVNSENAGTETVAQRYEPREGGALTDVEYVPNANITGVNTNNRTVALVEATATPTTLASVTFSAGTNGTANSPTPMAIASANFVAAVPLDVTSTPAGTGAVEPGGIVYFVYTRA